jgi:membrane protein DedA with SNARE-associated domain
MSQQAVVHWITACGYPGIFVLLTLGIVGLPIPDEWLLVFAGCLAFKNVLGLFPTLVVAGLGSASGLTASYFLGTVSGGWVRKYGKWISITDERLGGVRKWFQSLGQWVLICGPFIPGVRNLMGFVAGASGLELTAFARFAYVGAFLSSTTFVAFGYFVGRHIDWQNPASGIVVMMFPLVLILSSVIAKALRKIRLRFYAFNFPRFAKTANSQ